MKKLFTTLSVLAAAVLTGNAQRNVDVQAVWDVPTGGYEINCVDSFQANYFFINNGPDPVYPSDTFAFADFESFFNSDNTINNIFVWHTTDTVYAGDTLLADAGWNSHYSRIGTLIDESGAFQSMSEQILAPGNYYAFCYFLSFGHVVNNSWVADTVNFDYVTDTNDVDFGAVVLNCEGLSIYDLSHKKTELKLFPNPSNGQFTISFDFAKTSSAAVRVTDVTGRTVLVKEFGKVTGSQQLQLDASGLNNGIYNVELITDDSRAFSKLTITK